MLLYGGVHTRTLLLCQSKVADGLRPGQTRQWKDFPLRLPATCPSKLYMCKVLDIKYCIAVSSIYPNSNVCTLTYRQPAQNGVLTDQLCRAIYCIHLSIMPMQIDITIT